MSSPVSNTKERSKSPKADTYNPKDWANQDLPVYAQTSKVAEMGRYIQMSQNQDMMGRTVFRTLEVAEDLNSS